MEWNWLSWVTGGLSGAVLTQAVNMWKDRGDAAKTERRNATLRQYAQLQAETYRDLLKQREEFAGSVTSVTVTIEARAALEAAVKAFRQIGDDMTALELEKTARAWELSHALPPAPNPREQQRRDEMIARLLQRAKEQESLHKHFFEKGRSLGGANTKNRTMWIQKAADAATAAAHAYREAGEVDQALRWEQTARNTIP